MDITLYGLRACDTCRKAIKALEAAGRPVTFHDVRDEGVSPSQLKAWAHSVGWQTLLITRSTTWRGLDDAEKASVDESKAIALMGEYPALIKRPVIVTGKETYVGWKTDTQAALGL